MWKKKLSNTLVVLLPVFLVAGISQAREDSADVKRMVAVKTNSPPKIDGRLDDSCWRLTHSSTGFIQLDPEEGEPAREQTIVRVLYDEDNLYFGIECSDSEPERIDARMAPRDGLVYPGDMIGLVLDTYHDHQNAYGFYTNPYGTCLDFHTEGDGSRDWGGTDYGWDGVWRSEAKINDKGWSLEMAIPFKTLRFSRGKEQVWGINIQRYRGCTRENSFWSPITRDDRGQILKVSKAGHLVGLKDLKHGLHLELLPYGTGRYQRKGSEAPPHWDGDFGLDLKYGMASNLTADITINPDFAHIEADEDQINLSRFELWLKEKRPFFIEGSELFTPMDLFYSRRIRDPHFGARMTGKVGDYSIGMLTAVDHAEEGPNPTYGVFRLKKDILQKSSIGVIGVGKQTKGQYSRALGVDLELRPWENYELDLKAAKSFNSGVRGNDGHISVVFSRSTDRFGFRSWFSRLDPEFNVDQTGYVPHDPHVGEKESGVFFNYTPRIGKLGIRKMYFGQSVEGEKRTDEEKWGWDWTNVDFQMEFENVSDFRFTHTDWLWRWRHQEFRGDTSEVGFTSGGEGIFRPEVWAWFGDQYDFGDDYFGSIRRVSVGGKIRLLENLSFALNGSLVWEYFPSGKFDELKQTWYMRTTYLVSRDLFLRAFFQVNPTTESGDLNLLLSYAYRPLSRFYLTYNESRDKTAGNLRMTNRIFFTKVSYLWNL